MYHLGTGKKVVQGTFLGVDGCNDVADSVEDESRLGKQAKNVTDDCTGNFELGSVGAFYLQM